MSVRLICLSTISAALLAACATSQENPNYQHSTKYKASSPYGAGTSGSTSTTATTQPVRYVQSSTSTQSAAPVTYSGSSATQYQTISANTGYTQLDHSCLDRENRNQLIGGALGGTIGAVAGKKYIGGTAGTVAGAAIGGTAGYGIGDKTVRCDPVSVPVTQSSTIAAQPYYSQTQFAQPNQPAPTYTAPTDRAYGGTGVGTPGYDAVMGSMGGNSTTYAPQPQPTYTHAAPQQPVYVNPQPVYVQPPAAYVPPGAYVPPASMTTVSTAPAQPIYGTAGYAPHQVSQGDTVYSMSRQLCVSVDEIRQINSLDTNFNIKLGEFIHLPTSRC